MSVTEIIQQIQTLTSEERRELMRLLGELPLIDATTDMKVIRYATDEQARAAGDYVLKEHEELFRKLAE
jgi:hypothetical protein